MKLLTCSQDGVIRINQQLADAVNVSIRYVVAHEIFHLLHRNYSDAFWQVLWYVMPD
ncbi:hypothetical protein CEN44_07870 [Fischerella muscicola CCMEE 5323]|uniref:YgjP-like metallopeptidase domain-containing protein n=1 Tax=Fischerella muscicola CCMEE 5323 TaxID=2019572 RepID=A0A2N6K5P7_FISMU|nr:hypothetical protein CEN44_07870 [Fischerella muscicola CCMEE 5323]